MVGLIRQGERRTHSPGLTSHSAQRYRAVVPGPVCVCAPCQNPPITTLAIIPARGGSKGLPGKNLAVVGGRSLVARAVDAARDARGVNAVLVSSDDEGLLEEGRRAGARGVLRPEHLARDHSSTLAVVLHHLSAEPGVGRVVVLQPTSPLRTGQDVERCLAALDAGAASAATVVDGHPVEWVFEMDRTGRLEPVRGWPLPRRRQEAAPVVELNGAVYAATSEHLRAGGALVGPGTVGVVMPRERSVDVDSAVDLELARLLAGERS